VGREILSMSEETELPHVIKIIRAGLKHVNVPEDVRAYLVEWCNEEEEYLHGDEEE